MFAACGSSKSPSPSDASDAHENGHADAASDATDGKKGEPSDALDAPSSDASDGNVACAPACAADKTCIDGACLPSPVVLARAPGCGAAHLALADGNVYWTESATGFVKTVAVANPGAMPATIATHQMTPGPIATDGTAVYWGNAGDMTLMRATLGGDVDGGADGGATDGGVQPLLTSGSAVNGLLATGGFVYYTSGPSTLRVAGTGGAPLTLASFASCRPTSPFALALDTDYIYQTDSANQYVTRLRKDGTQLVNSPCADAGTAQIAAPETVTHSQGELFLAAIYRAGDEVVWADHNNIYAKVPGAVAGREVATSAGEDTITGFVVTGANVYLGEGVDQMTPTSDSIQVAPLGTPEGGATPPAGNVIALGQHAAASFAADATHVYWTTHTPSTTAGAADDCAIVSLAK